MQAENVAKLFSKMGGEFISSPILLSTKLKKVKALIFDWDGVWHDGKKDGSGRSTFSEVDSMGLNMLRFGYYLLHGEIPITLIITGENNLTAFDFAEREHLDGVFFKAKNKLESYAFIKEKWSLEDEQVLFVFDDILDLAMAEKAGVGFLMNRMGSPMMHELTLKNSWADYKSAAYGGDHGVREICELSLALLDKFDEVVEKRMRFDQAYKTYWELRNKQSTRFYTSGGKGVSEVSKPT